jgi:hypothetical protein
VVAPAEGEERRKKLLLFLSFIAARDTIALNFRANGASAMLCG